MAENGMRREGQDRQQDERGISACALTSEPAGHTRAYCDFSLLFDAREVSVMTCMLHGQTQIASWKERHEGWDVEQWQYRPRDLRESRI